MCVSGGNADVDGENVGDVPTRGDYEAARSEVGAEVRRLRDAAGMKQTRLAAKVQLLGVYAGQAAISKLETGRELPSARVVEAIDEVLNAGGQLVEMDDRARRLKDAERVGVPSARAAAAEEESPANRREFALATAGIAVAISDEIARATPTPWTLREIAADLRAMPAAFRATPHADLAPQVEERWQGVEALVKTPASGRVRPRLATYAGQYAYWLAQISFQAGDDQGAEAFVILADQRAQEGGDALLIGAVAFLDSSLAYFRGDYAAAADIAGRMLADPDLHPHTRPTLAAFEARAAALDGQTDRARRSLRQMQDSVWTGEPIPGWTSFGEQARHIYSATVYARLGDGEIAERHARTVIEMADPGDPLNLGDAYNEMGQAFLRRDRPDPERAAGAIREAMAALNGRPYRSVIQQSAQMVGLMSARWPTLPAVRELGEQVHSARLALPAGKTV